MLRSALSALAMTSLLGLGSPGTAVAAPARAAKARAAKPAAQAAKAKVAKGKATRAKKTAELKGKGKKKPSPTATAAKTTKLAKAYAKEHGFSVRTIEVGPPNRRVTRTFVPVTPKSHDSFHERFTAGGGNGSVVLRYSPHGMPYPHLVLSYEKDSLYLWAQNKNIGGNGNEFYREKYLQKDANHEAWPGLSIAVYPSSMKGLQGFLTAQAGNNEWCGGNCMRWLPNAATGKGKTLFQDLGIKRSIDGTNMTAKIVHAGNQRVGVIGVHVKTKKEFDALSEEKLLGVPEPKGGVAAAAIK